MWRLPISLLLISAAIGASGYAFAASDHGPIRQFFAGIDASHWLNVGLFLLVVGLIVRGHYVAESRLQDAKDNQAELARTASISHEAQQWAPKLVQVVDTFQGQVDRLTAELERDRITRQEQVKASELIAARTEMAAAEVSEGLAVIQAIRAGSGR